MKAKTKLKAWMLEKGYSNSQLAQELGLGYDCIYKIAVRGDRNITDAFRWRFSERFGRDEAARVFDLQPTEDVAA